MTKQTPKQAKRAEKKARRAEQRDAVEEAQRLLLWQRLVSCDVCGEIQMNEDGPVETWGVPDFNRNGKKILGYGFYDLDGDYAQPAVCCGPSGSWFVRFAMP